MGKLSRNKGANFERRIANWMNTLGLRSTVWRRELRETQQGNIGDVRDSTGDYPIVIQCKHMKNPSPFRALEEAKVAALKGRGRADLGVAMIRRHGGSDMVCMTPSLFGSMMVAVEALMEYWDEATPYDVLTTRKEVW